MVTECAKCGPGRLEAGGARGVCRFAVCARDQEPWISPEPSREARSTQSGADGRLDVDHDHLVELVAIEVQCVPALTGPDLVKSECSVCTVRANDASHCLRIFEGLHEMGESQAEGETLSAHFQAVRSGEDGRCEAASSRCHLLPPIPRPGCWPRRRQASQSSRSSGSASCQYLPRCHKNDKNSR